jgi:urease accessory protein
MTRHARVAVLLLAVLAPPVAFAHTSGEAHTHGWAEGLAHPLSGLDHLAVMICVGFWAAMRPGAGMWLVPAVFVGGMTAGLFSGLAAPPGIVEGGVILSLLVLGAALVFAVRLPAWAGMLAAAVAGLMHGAAHAGEAPTETGFAAFAIGALVTTALLHAAGGLAGVSLRTRMPLIAPAAGIVLAGFGFSLAAQAM